MSDNTRRADDAADDPHVGDDPLGLEAYLERQLHEFANGPTMADLLARADARRSDGVSREEIMRTQREQRDAGEPPSFR